MATNEHETVTRESFRRQVGLFTGPDSPFARREISALSWLEPLDENMVALEVACGASHVAETVAPRVRQIVGIDLTPELLALGAERLRAAGIDNVLLQEGNAERLPFVDGSFDIVFSRASLHHFDDPKRAITEMARVCRPGGRIVLGDIVSPSAEERDAYDEVHRLIDPSHQRVFLEAELADAFPPGVTLSYGETTSMHIPLDVFLTDQSDRDATLARLEAELDGGASTGFDPQRTDDGFEVSFTMCVIEGTVAAG